MNDKLNVEVLNVLFKVFQRYKFEKPIPKNIVEIVREYIDSLQIPIQFKEIRSLKKKRHFEIGWDQDHLLTNLVTLSAKLFEPRIEEFKKVHIETKNKWFLNNNTNIKGEYGELSFELGIITEIILNQEKYLPGFKYFYEFELNSYNEETHCGDLLFISEVGVLAVVGIKYLDINNLKKKQIKEQIRKFKVFANKRFGNKFVAIIGFNAIRNLNGKITLSAIDPFDRKIAKNVREFVEDKYEETSSTDSSSESYSDSEEGNDDTDLNDDEEDSSQNDQGSKVLKVLKSIVRFIIIIYILDFIYKTHLRKKEIED